MIHVRELTKTYADLRRGQVVALSGLTFDAYEGQIYGLLGPNGAGKTTALRILSTVLRPSGGSASINGYNVVTQPSIVRRRPVRPSEWNWNLRAHQSHSNHIGEPHRL